MQFCKLKILFTTSWCRAIPHSLQIQTRHIELTVQLPLFFARSLPGSRNKDSGNRSPTCGTGLFPAASLCMLCTHKTLSLTLRATIPQAALCSKACGETGGSRRLRKPSSALKQWNLNQQKKHQQEAQKSPNTTAMPVACGILRTGCLRE